MNEATIFDMQRNSFTDGPGIRTTVFFKGCNLRCAWCHNPESQQAEAEWLLKPTQCTGCGRCADVRAEDPDFLCPVGARTGCGRRYTVAKLWEEIGKDRLFYDASGGGVTFSGGECMLQVEFLEAILKQCKEAGIHTAVDTAGHVPYEAFARILPYTDLILYDVKCMDPVIQMLKDAFKLSPSVWSTSLALLCGIAGVVLAGVLGFAAAVTPAWKSASMDPQAAITQGEVN